MSFLKNIADLQKFVKVSKDLKIDKLAEGFDIIENMIIKPVLGNQLYNVLHDKYNSETPQWQNSEAQAVLMIQKVVAPLALAMKFRILGVMIDDTGTYKNKNEGKWFLSDDEITRIETGLRTEGYGALEILLQFLEETASDTVLAGYTTSTNQLAYKDLMIKNSGQFSEIFETYGRFMVFRVLRPLLKSIQRDFIKPLLGRQLYAEVITKSDADEGYNELLYLIRRAMVYLSLSRGIKEQKVMLNAGSVTIFDERERLDGRKSASASDAASSSDTMSEQADTYLATVKEFLEENAANFPLYEKEGPAENINEKDWGIFIT